MNFEDWWMQLHPAEIDELKPVFEDCWKQAKREALIEAVVEWKKPYGLTDGSRFITRLERMAEEME